MRAPSILKWVVIHCLAVALLAPWGLAQRADPFNVDGHRARQATVLMPGSNGSEPVADNPMAWTLAGVVARLDRATMRGLFRCVNSGASRGEAPAGAAPAYRIRLEAGGQHSWREVIRDREGRHWFIVESEGGAIRAMPMADARFKEMAEDWPRFQGSVGPSSVDQPLGEVFDVERPLESSSYVLDGASLKQRVFGRIRTAFGSATVDLSRAQFAARLPSGYDPRRPCGLLVWVAPRDQWKVPQQLHAALDEMNVVCIGALNSGNERPPPDRMQLALHGVAIAQARWHIDPRRVYVTGMSGGAKIATMLWAAYPEVFKGAIPIVGLASYRNTPTGNAREHWPAVFAKPDGRRFKMLKEHPLAPMTGPPDFNYKNMVPMAAGLERDGLPVKMFIYEGMGHVMPQPPHFHEALGWVDEPYQSVRSAETSDAAAALQSYRSSQGDSSPETEAQREQLAQIMASAPWSEPAWQAFELLSKGAAQN